VGAVKAVLTVRRGHVDVTALRRRQPASTLGPGDQMVWVEGQTAAPTRNIDPNLAFDWENHRLDYDKAPLSDVVMDLNRYVDRPISLLPAALGDLTFTGVLTLDSEDAMLKRLEQALPIRAQNLPAAIILKPRPAPTKSKATRPLRPPPKVAPPL
jgi:transmembrane sensor